MMGDFFKSFKSTLGKILGGIVGTVILIIVFMMTISIVFIVTAFLLALSGLAVIL